METAWIVPMTIGLCLDMCGIFLLSKGITSSKQTVKELKDMMLYCRQRFEFANDVLNGKISQGGDFLNPKLHLNEIYRIEYNLTNFQLGFFEDIEKKKKDNISTMIIIFFGLSLMMVGTMLLV